MKKKLLIIGGILILFTSLYLIDREVWMKKRVLQHQLWDYESGNYIGSFIRTENAHFEKNLLIYNRTYEKKDTIKLIYQYFGTMKVQDPKTKKTSIYLMYGRNWTQYLFD